MFFLQNHRRCRLHGAVANHPQGHEAARLPKFPAENGREKNRQCHHEPDIARTEQEKSRDGKQVDASITGEHLRELCLLVGFAQITAHQHSCQHHGHADDPHQHRHSLRKNHQCEQQGAKKKAHALERIFAAREPRDPTIELSFAIASDQFHRALAAHFREIFRDSAQCLRNHHISNRQ